MNHSIITRKSTRNILAAFFALWALTAMTSCGFVQSKIADEATKELAHHVEHRVESEAASAGRSTSDYSILHDALHDVIVEEARHDNGSFDPRYTGLDDSDGDGLDDDGDIEIIVRQSSSCVHTGGDEASVEAGPC